MASDHSAEARQAHRAATLALSAFPCVPGPVREELAQDAALRTLTRAGVLRPAPFAARVAKRLAIDWLRRRSEHALPDPTAVLEPQPWEPRVEALLELLRVEALLERAPRTCRETLRLLYLEDTTLAEAVDLRLRADPSADRDQERDLLYKRRKRALAWIRNAWADAA